MRFVPRGARGCRRHPKAQQQWPHVPAGSVTPWICSCTQSTWASPSPRALAQVPRAPPTSQGGISNQPPKVWINLPRVVSPALTPRKSPTLISLLSVNLFNKDHLAPWCSQGWRSVRWVFQSDSHQARNSYRPALKQQSMKTLLLQNLRLAWSCQACTLELLFPQALLKTQPVYSFNEKISFFRAPSVEKQREKT